MIKIFGATDKIYTSNGDIVLQSIKAKVHKALNGDFYIDLEAPLTYVDYLVSNNIIVANTPQGEQAFRIGNVDKTKSKIKCKAYHVFYDTKNYLIQDSRVENRDCNYALDYFNSNTDNTSPSSTIYYPLATPVETDISEYIDTEFIEVEPNGTLTFNNTYEQAVPSDIDYLIEEVKA